MKYALWLIAALVAFQLWQKFAPNVPAIGSEQKVMVIEASTTEELLAKLRRVKAGTPVEVRFESAVQTINTGIRCSDHAAKAAYIAQQQREHEREQQLINAELKRIYGSAE
jgi:hypothetical protein